MVLSNNTWQSSLIKQIADLDPNRVISERVFDGKTEEQKDISYQSVKVVGNGSFGVVFQIRLVEQAEDAAIKRVLQDKRFKVFPPRFSPCSSLVHPLMCRIESYRS